MRLFTLALALIVSLLGGALLPSSASADPATFVLVPAQRADRPHIVPTGPGYEPFHWNLALNADATNVVVHVEGDGLTFDQDTFSYGDLAAGEYLLDYAEVTATGPGFHAMTITVDADDAEPVSVTLPRLWAPGGPPIAGGGDLTGRGYGWSGFVSGVVAESSTRVTTMLNFTDHTYAYVGLPRRGIGCPAPGCVPYYYDTSTGLVQVGDDLIGQVLGPELFIEGLTPPDPELGEFRASAVLDDAVGWTRHERYSRTWGYSTGTYPSGLVHQRLTLNRNGTYQLSFRYEDNPVRRLSGTYRFGGRGGIAFRNSRTGAVLRGTFLVREAPDGTPKPGSRGIWLTLELKRSTGTVVDGNALRPR